MTGNRNHLDSTEEQPIVPSVPPDVRVYEGSRDAHGETTVTVRSARQAPRMLPVGLEHLRHSPTGFEWGYGGSGPAQLSFAILLDHFGHGHHGNAVELARANYQGLKRLIARLPEVRDYPGAWSLSTTDIDAALLAVARWVNEDRAASAGSALDEIARDAVAKARGRRAMAASKPSACAPQPVAPVSWPQFDAAVLHVVDVAGELVGRYVADRGDNWDEKTVFVDAQTFRRLQDAVATYSKAVAALRPHVYGAGGGGPGDVDPKESPTLDLAAQKKAMKLAREYAWLSHREGPKSERVLALQEEIFGLVGTLLDGQPTIPTLIRAIMAGDDAGDPPSSS